MGNQISARYPKPIQPATPVKPSRTTIHLSKKNPATITSQAIQ